MHPVSLRRVRWSPIVIAAIAAAACSSEPTTPARSIRPNLSLSRSGPGLGARHVFLLNGAVPSDFADQVRAKGGNVVSERDQVRLIITSGLTDADAAALAGSGQVARDVFARWLPQPAELDASVANLAPVAVSPALRSPRSAAFLDQQWNMSQINALKAWRSVTGNPSVRVAILDTGLDPDHPELAGLIDTDLSAAAVPSTAGAGLPDWTDDETHGSFVGGIITSNNIGVAGVAPNVRLVAVKVLDQTGSGNFGDIIDGMAYAAIVAHAQVINMSLGATGPADDPDFQTLADILTQVVNIITNTYGTLVVSAAGNEGVDLGQPHGFLSLPCEAGPQLCVSATTFNDKLASYSNFGLHAVDVAAPGGDGKVNDHTVANKWVLSLCSTHAAFCHVGNQVALYAFATGTSASAPHVAGLAALLDSQMGGTMSPLDMMNQIRKGADDIGNGPLGGSRFGDGRIDVAKTLQVRGRGN
jgi:subtilisin family serine protease